MKKAQLFRRLSFGSSALLLAVSATLPSLLGQVAHALPVGDQVTSRSIQLSSSALDAANTTYNVSFTAATTHTVRGIVVDICDGTNTPIIGDASCTAPTDFTWGTPTVTLTSGISGGNWVANATTMNSGRTLVLTDATGNALTGGSTVVNFQVTSVNNPSDTDSVQANAQAGTFYARIVTYTSTSGDISTYTPAAPGSTDATDYGGIALSLANALTVTAKVQESLTFCVYTNAADTCDNIASPTTAVTLGNGNGVLELASQDYESDEGKFNVSSNAQGGVTVRMKAENLCRKSVSTDCEDADVENIIEAHGATCTADSVDTGVEQFGLRFESLGTDVTSADYNCAANEHNFNTTDMTSAYGDVLATTAGPTDEVTSVMEFSAKAATTTEAGIYTTQAEFIATGTY